MTESTTDFDALPWHDAVLLGISIDRRTPGENDEVMMSVRWGTGRETRLRFIDCYAFDARMRFGIVAEEAIREARRIHDSEELHDLQQKWSRVGADLSNLQCFEMSTSATASIIRIFASSFVIVP